jgi:hypothetical protein
MSSECRYAQNLSSQTQDGRPLAASFQTPNPKPQTLDAKFLGRGLSPSLQFPDPRPPNTYQPPTALPCGFSRRSSRKVDLKNRDPDPGPEFPTLPDSAFLRLLPAGLSNSSLQR